MVILPYSCVVHKNVLLNALNTTLGCLSVHCSIRVIPYSGKFSEKYFRNVGHFPKIYFRKAFVVLLTMSDYSNSVAI